MALKIQMRCRKMSLTQSNQGRWEDCGTSKKDTHKETGGTTAKVEAGTIEGKLISALAKELSDVEEGMFVGGNPQESHIDTILGEEETPSLPWSGDFVIHCSLYHGSLVLLCNAEVMSVVVEFFKPVYWIGVSGIENASKILAVAWLTVPIGIVTSAATCAFIFWWQGLSFSEHYAQAVLIHGKVIPVTGKHVSGT
eukprot:Gb_11884 [translate_table: standard]